jgi:hypothetical protein
MDTKITPKEVKKWYEASGLTPAFGVWVDFEQQLACPLSARFAAANPAAWKAYDEGNLPVTAEQAAEQDARNAYGDDYTEGFIRGWDANGGPMWCSSEYLQGYKDGVRAAHDIVPERAAWIRERAEWALAQKAE